MSVPITCPHCGTAFRVKDRFIGKQGACPFCGGLIFVDVSDPASGPLRDEIYFTRQCAPSPSASQSLTHLSVAACPACGKNNLVGCPTCYHCGIHLPDMLPEDNARG